MCQGEGVILNEGFKKNPDKTSTTIEGSKEVPPIQGVFCKWILHFLARARKRKQKKTPVSRGPCGPALRVVDTTGARGNSPHLRQGYGETQTSPRALIRSHRRCSARDKGKFKIKTLKTVYRLLSRELLEDSCSAGGLINEIGTNGEEMI